MSRPRSRRAIARDNHQRRIPAGKQWHPLRESTKRELLQVEKRLGYRFHDRCLLRVALSHRSAVCNERFESYEALEFFGDRVLSFELARFAYTHAPGITPLELANLEREVLCNERLAALCRYHGFQQFIRINAKTPRESIDKVHADVVEALCGAVARDGTPEDTFRVVLHIISPALLRSTSLLSEEHASRFETELALLHSRDSAGNLSATSRSKGAKEQLNTEQLPSATPDSIVTDGHDGIYASIGY